uniref:Paired domain-containing protein n=1 Tax=Labrus bergylta TaxID=56723 RepID=A0A3Q3H361_9LABR
WGNLFLPSVLQRGSYSSSEGAIGQELRMPKSTVHSIIVKYRLSNTVENLPRGGRRSHVSTDFEFLQIDVPKHAQDTWKTH